MTERITNFRNGAMAIILFFAMAEGKAQPYHHDYEQWLSLKVSASPGKKWAVSGQYVFRNYGLLENFKGSYYYAQGRYTLSKHWYPDAVIRVQNSYFADAFRLEIGMQYRWRRKKDAVFLRVAYYNEREHLLPDSRLYNPPDNYMRDRIRYRRVLPKKFMGYASIESWIKFDPGYTYLKRWAFVGGIDREFFDRHHLILEYLYQVEYDKKEPVILNSLTLGYEYVFTKYRYHRKGHGDERDER